MMARANNKGWDFIKVGEIYQYKEEGNVCMVEILEDRSTVDFYKFKLKVLASDGGFPVGITFECSHSKEPGGYWNEMLQFYEKPEYIPLPLGKPWPNALPGYEFEGLK